MVDAVIGAAVLASVHDSRWFPRKTAPRKQIGTPRPCKPLSLSLCRWRCPKNGNWLLRRVEHGVASSEGALWDGLRVLTSETPSVRYGCIDAGTNHKTTPFAPSFKLLH